MRSARKNELETLSPNQRAWRRLMKNKPAAGGLIIIALAVLIALLAYLLAPDNSPDANDQIPEIALEEPGFHIRLLKVRQNRKFPTQSWFEKCWAGSPNVFKMIPINAYTFRNDSIIVEKFAGRDRENQTLYKGVSLGFHLGDVVFPLVAKDAIRKTVEGELVVTKIGQQKQNVRISDLQHLIESEHIVAKTYYLGADRFGRSVLSRLILGVRISLTVGLIAVVISLTIGIFLGALAGYFGGWLDDLVMLLINTIWSIPTLILVFAIVLALGRGIGIIFLAVGLTMWVDVARIVRGQVMGLRNMPFVEAAQSMGFSTARIIRKHILPNILGPVMVIAAANFATAILIEAGLSYLGFGIKPPTPSWGTMLNENYGYAISGKPFLALIPALAIMIMVLAFNLVGNGLRDALDVRSKD
ncbi:MAG: ABC transporter permease [Bacteroidota bacterium]